MTAARGRAAGAPGPLMPDVGVIALVQDRWSDLWQPRHHVLTRLGAYFHVVWVNPAPEWRDTLAGRRPPSARPDGMPPGFSIYEPEPWLPVFHRPSWLSTLTTRLRLARARRILAARGCKTFVLYLWRPEYAGALDLVPHDLSCYHIDDEYSYSEAEQPLDVDEARLIERVDQVFIHSPALLEKKGGLNPNTAFVPNGVDYDAHAAASSEPDDLRAISRPRIGYTGFVKKQLDWALVEWLAARHPEWEFVFVGARRPHPEIDGVLRRLDEKRHVHFLGAKPVHELARYPQHFDVCIMPYRASDYTKYIYPMKLHEYLASGRPTVGTRIPSLDGAADVVSLVSTPEEWSGAIAGALEPAARAPERAQARRDMARRHDWNRLVERVAQAMAARLGERFLSRLQPLSRDAAAS
ncbi:MAG: glycosyltransferase [Gemmatimonadaceae bacterium]